MQNLPVQEEIREGAGLGKFRMLVKLVGTPAKVCGSDGTFASRTTCNKCWLFSGGMVTSDKPWKITVGG